MRSIPFSLMVTLLFVSGSVWAQIIKNGDEARVPGHAWVTVVNPKPIRSVNNYFLCGDTCGIQRGDRVAVVAFVNEGNQEQVLVRYTARGISGGAMCPSGTLFFTTKQEFDAMTAAYNRSIERSIEAEQQGRRLIEQILGIEKR